MTLTSRKFFLSRAKIPQFLNELEDTNDTTAKSVYMPPGLPISEITGLLEKARISFTPNEPKDTASKSKTGAVLFWSSKRKCLVLPPFPFEEKVIFTGHVTEPLRQLLDSDFKIGLILVHLGTYAIGICQGEKLISSKVGTGLVHGRHKKGGSSQQRFQRRRQNQAQEFLDRVCAHIMEKFQPHVQYLDYIVYGGPRQTVLLLQKRCPFLKPLEDRVLPLMDVQSLRQKVLEAAVSSLWSSYIIEWQEDEVER